MAGALAVVALLLFNPFVEPARLTPAIVGSDAAGDFVGATCRLILLSTVVTTKERMCGLGHDLRRRASRAQKCRGIYDSCCIGGRLMSTRIAVSWQCPKGHNVDDSFSKADLKNHLAAGRLTGVCPHCGGRELPDSSRTMEADSQRTFATRLERE